MVSAQQARVRKFAAPLSGTAVLRNVESKYDAQVFNLEAPSPDGDDEKAELQQIKERITELYPYRKLPKTNAKSTAAASPVVLASFKADSFPGIPPDNYMAISATNQAISVINSSITTIDGSTGQINTRTSLYDFSASTGLSGQNDYRYDPKVIYDPEADRFITVILNGINAYNWIIFGFSQTNDPAGAWNFYKFYGDYDNDTTWFDYPTIAITHNEIFLSGNKILFNGSWQAGFRQSVIYQVRKSDGYSGAAQLTYNLWDSIAFNNNIYLRNIFPVKGGAGPHGPGMYFLSNRNFDIQNDTVLLLKVTDTIGGSPALNVTPLESNLSYGVPPNARQDSSYDPNMSRLATNDGRILGAYVENDEIQFVSASINPSTGSSGVYVGKITSVLNSPSLTASMFAIDTIDFGYPNISYTGNQGGNTSIISFNYSGPHTFPGIGAIYYDGTQFSNLLKVKQGDSVIRVQFDLQRWGDYTASQPVYGSIGKVWISGIYGRKNRAYGLQIAQLGTSAFAGIGEKKQTAIATKTYPNPAWQYIQIEFETPREALVDFAIYDMQGKLVDRLKLCKCKKGRNILQFNIAALAAGNYILTGTDEKGAVLMTDKFTRQ